MVIGESCIFNCHDRKKFEENQLTSLIIIITRNCLTWCRKKGTRSMGKSSRTRAEPGEYVFLSHSSSDKDTAALVCSVLESLGIQCWIASRDILPGANWPESIQQAIDDCKAMVVVFSKHTNFSMHVPREVERAIARGTGDTCSWRQKADSPRNACRRGVEARHNPLGHVPLHIS
jgi:hypothetical protein